MSYLAPVLSAYICWRLLRLWKTLTFINLLYVIIFLGNIINVAIMIYFFFNIGYIAMIDGKVINSTHHAYKICFKDDMEELGFNCQHFINSFMVTNLVIGVPSCAIMFCRFIYSRYAHGLGPDKSKLFNKLVVLVMVVFTLHLVLIWPIHFALNIGTIQNTIMGKICTKAQIPEFLEKRPNLEFSIKPKLTIFALLAIFLFSSAYFYTSAIKQTKRYKIPSHRRNLMDINMNMLFIILIDLNGAANQIVNILVEVFYNKISPDTAFKIWWTFHLLVILQIQVLAQAVTIYSAHKNFPEFIGVKANRFKCQEGPRKIYVVPERRYERQQQSEMVSQTQNLANKTSQHILNNRSVQIEVHTPPHWSEVLNEITAVSSC